MTNIVKYKGTKDTGIDLSGATITTALKVADGAGAETTVTSPVKVNANEQGYLTIDVGGTTYYIPYFS